MMKEMEVKTQRLGRLGKVIKLPTCNYVNLLLASFSVSIFFTCCSAHHTSSSVSVHNSSSITINNKNNSNTTIASVASGSEPDKIILTLTIANNPDGNGYREPLMSILKNLSAIVKQEKPLTTLNNNESNNSHKLAASSTSPATSGNVGVQSSSIKRSVSRNQAQINKLPGSSIPGFTSIIATSTTNAGGVFTDIIPAPTTISKTAPTSTSTSTTTTTSTTSTTTTTTTTTPTTNLASVASDEIEDPKGDGSAIVRNHADSPVGDRWIPIMSNSKHYNDCICVPYYQCDENEQIITDGAGILDPRSLIPMNITLPSRQPSSSNKLTNNRRHQHHHQHHQMTLSPRSSVTADSPLDGEDYSDEVSGKSCGRYHVCCRDPDAMPKQTYRPRCGIRNHVGINRRILAPSSNQESDFGEYPWMAAIIRHENNVNVFVCGGSLISELYVLTVAHCVESYIEGTTDTNDGGGSKKKLLKVRLSEWDTQRTDEFLSHEDFEVAEIILHPKFQARNLWNDIAILELARPVNFRPGIDTICLPPKRNLVESSTPSDYINNNRNISSGGSRIRSRRNCIATGWGKDAYRSGQHSNILKEVELNLVDQQECEQALRKTRLGFKFKLHQTFLCGGGEPASDTCTGDGGGPLICTQQTDENSLSGPTDDIDDFGPYELTGLVSWGVSCGLQGVPGVYVDVSQYIDWILLNTNHLRGGTSLQKKLSQQR